MPAVESLVAVLLPQLWERRIYKTATLRLELISNANRFTSNARLGKNLLLALDVWRVAFRFQNMAPLSHPS